MIIGTGTVWVIATMSDLINSTFVFIIGSKIKKNKHPRVYIKWRKI
jgi:hypothetical protein